VFVDEAPVVAGFLVAGVDGHLAGADLLAPGGELLEQTVGQVGFLRGEVGRLARVVHEVEEADGGADAGDRALEPLDQLVVALPNRAGRHVAEVVIVRVVEVERVAVESAAAFQHWQKAQTVDVGGQLVDVEDVGDRREEVVRDDQLVAGAARLHDARPLDGQRHADAAFPDHRLAAAEGVLGLELLEAAVVGVEDDDRAIGEPVLLDAVEDLAEAGVHRLDHRPHDRVVDRVVGAGLRLVPGDQLRVLEERAVDDVVGDVEEERVVPVRIEEGERALGDLVGVVGVGEGVVLVLRLDRGQDVVEALGLGVHRPAGHVLLVNVEVPLAEVAGGVALELEQLGNRDFLERQAGDLRRA